MTTTTRMTNLNVQIVFPFAGKEKYPAKVMVWVAIYNRGISKPLFRPLKSEAVDYNYLKSGHLYKRMFRETFASFHL